MTALALPLPRAALAALLLVGGDGAAVPTRFERPALGGLAVLELVPTAALDDERLAEVAERCFAALDELEAAVNLWSPGSALARFNAAAGPDERALPDGVGPLLARALAFAEESGGAFDPTLGVPLRELGLYGDPPGEEPAPEVRASWRARAGRHLVRVAPDGDRWLLRGAPVELDLSALAKGVGAERCIDLLRSAGVTNARVSLGASSVAAMGPGPGPAAGDARARGWPVALDTSEEPVTWWLRDEALAVSGQASITYESAGERRSHLLDPRTLAPVEHRTRRVAVRGPSAGDCDMASTALLVLGADAGAAWIAAHPEWATRHDAVFWSVPARTDAGPDVLRLERARPDGAPPAEPSPLR